MNDPHGRDETGRDAHGRFAPGASGNPGGRPRLPDWFRDGGAEALRYLLDVATGAVPVEREELRVRAAEWCAERVYGKAAPPMDDGPEGLRPSPVVVALLEGMSAGGVRSNNEVLARLLTAWGDKA